MAESAGEKITCVVMGDESLLIQCGEALRDRGHAIAAVVTATDQIAAWAKSQGLPTVAPGKDLEQALAPYAYDWFFSIANLQIIPGGVWRKASAGAANFHDGPLPRYAGLNTPVWAILAGDTRYGVTWHALSDGIDEGDIYAEQAIDISDDDTALTLNTKCFEAGIASFAELIANIEAGSLKGQPQSFGERIYFAKNARPKAAATIDFSQSASEIGRLARALTFGERYANPVCLPKIKTKSGAFAVTGLKVEEAAPAGAAPGTVVSVDDTGAAIATADGIVRIKAIHDSTGSPVPLADVLKAGDQLDSLSAAEADRLTELTGALAKHESYFRDRLRDTPSPDIQGLAPQSANAATTIETLRFPIPAGWNADRTISALASFFARTGNQSRFQFAYADDRLDTDGKANAGYVAPTVPLAFEIDPGTTISALAAKAATELTEARRRPGYAADLISCHPKLASARATIAVRETNDVATASLVEGSALTFVVPTNGDELSVHADTSRLARSGLDLLARQLRAILTGLETADTSRTVADLPILTPTEIQELTVERNKTDRAYDRNCLVHQLIEHQAAKTPDATALICNGETLTYRELETRASRVAATLSSLGVGPDTLVGLYVGRSCDLVVGALAILKAGGAYVPLDPTYPKDRVALMIEDSGLSVILTEEGRDPPVESANIRVLSVEKAAATAAAPTSTTPPTSSNLAYVIYTSGSTGRPKGVMVEHRNVVNFFAGMDDRIPRPASGQPVWLAVTSLSFDISVLELFWTLANGFAVVIHASQHRAGATGSRKPGSKSALDFSLYFWGNDDGAGPRKYQLLLEGARYADAHGFRAVWTPERHFHAFGGPYPNPSVTGAAVAAVTRNLDIRAGSCVLPLHHPARVAEEWAVIDNISNGRAGIAFASGWMPEDFLLRPENAPPHNKTALLRDIEVVRRLWRGEAVPFDAPGGKKVDVLTQPRPVSKELPVWVTTAGNPDTYRDAARAGANVLTHLLGQSIDEVAGKIRIYRDTLRETGRNPADYTVTLMLHTLIGRDREEVRAAAREPMKAYLRSAAALIKEYAWAFPAFKKPQGVTKPMEIDLQSLDPEEVDAIIEFAFLRYFDDSGLFGTVDDALARAEQLTAIGVDEIACLIDFGVPTETALHALEPLAEVVAAVRSQGSDQPIEIGDESSLAALIRAHGVTHMQCTPSMAAMVLMSDEDRDALRAVKHLFIGGEALQPALLNDLRKATEASIENMYGPTETTIWSSTGPALPGLEGAVPLGTPIANTQLYILDDARRLVPKGVAGELYIGGDGVTRGYLGRDDLTQERFLPNPFMTGGRIYRTGDLVRIEEDGNIHFLGRADHQVKVRGYRIELGEIEARIGLHPAVAESVVVAREDEPNDVRIVAYVRYEQAAVPESELKAHVRGVLPDFMVPAHFVTMKSFPLTPNAKVDRKALPRPEEASRAKPTVEYIAPANDLQVRLSDAFKRLLGVERVGAFDNFFTLGGHSLLAVQLHRDLKANVAPELTITDIYRFPTVSGLAGHIQDRGQASKHLGQVADRAAARRQAMLGRRAAPERTREVS
jgi:natural product biosynthesis luciferase-like monooxygenase protein